MLSVDQTWCAIDALTLPPSRTETCALENAGRRILAADLLAPEDLPAFNRSSIDGYLVAPDQTASIVELVGTIQPGNPAPAALPKIGTALRVLTGSALPDGAALVMQEDTEVVSTHQLRLNAPGRNGLVRPRGSQAPRGTCLLPAGTELGPGALALLASVGCAQPLVRTRPMVAHLVTGGELLDPSAPSAPGAIRDSNSTLMRALIQDAGAERSWHERVGDDLELTRAALERALVSRPDLLLISGGASVGDHDHSASLLEQAGFTLHCRKVASRPGKPFVLASRGTTWACVLPGNPLSHFVCFHLFVRRMLDRLLLRAPRGVVPLEVDSEARGRLTPNPRESWWPATPTPSGWRVLRWADSSDLTNLASTRALIRVPSGGVGTQIVGLLTD